MKLDFRKAYESVRSVFMDQVLEKMGFGRIWHRWIWSCLTLAEMSIIINDSPSKPFKIEKGLRQGNPLSLFFFVLVVDALNRLLERAVSAGTIEGINVRSRDVTCAGWGRGVPLRSPSLSPALILVMKDFSSHPCSSLLRRWSRGPQTQ